MEFFTHSLLAGLLAATSQSSGVQSSAAQFFRDYYAKFGGLAIKRDLSGIEKLQWDTYAVDYQGDSDPTPPRQNASLMILMPGYPGAQRQTPTVGFSKAIRDTRVALEGMGTIMKFAGWINNLKTGNSSALVRVTWVIAGTTKATQAVPPTWFDSETIVENHWIKAGPTWKLSGTKTLSVKVSVDGQSYSRRAPGMSESG